nr:Rap1a/Tai family immunity protein [Pseudomonas agronomica]
MADGSKLLRQCQEALTIFDGGTANNNTDAAMCLGTINGTVDGLDIAHMLYSQEAKKQLKRIICWPEGNVTKDQSLRIVVKYLKEHPESLHFGESTLITLALVSAFPCGTGK